MDGFQIFLIASLIAGVVMMFVGALGSRGGKPEDAGGDFEARLDKYSARLSEADNALSELDSLSRDVFAQFDEKYKELLFLYNMIDEKKQAAVKPAPAAPPKTPLPKIPRGYNNEKFNSVRKLRESGMEPDEIAKELKIGKGEVSLILELSKRA